MTADALSLNREKPCPSSAHFSICTPRRWVRALLRFAGALSPFPSFPFLRPFLHPGAPYKHTLPPASFLCSAQFGSGWAWLVTDSSGKLSISKTPNAVLPVVDGKTPVLTVDVWEVSTGPRLVVGVD